MLEKVQISIHSLRSAIEDFGALANNSGERVCDYLKRG